jgi:xanthine dehydrogenase YagS FAD-binding subunit
MLPFVYRRVDSLDAARAALLEHKGAALIAGGTTLIDLMKGGVEAPSLLIDINRLPLAAIEIRPNAVRIGTLARLSDVAEDATVAARFPAVAEALLAGASGQLRNMATIGGNLLQRTRCPYFREVANRCNKRAPGSGCDALEGYNRGHALLGTSDACIATHASDLCVALAACDATIVVAAGSGEKRLPIGDFYHLPGDHPERETVLEPGEMIVAVELAPSAARAHSLYLKLRDRASYEFALVSVAAGLEVVGGTIRDAALALGGVGTVPWRARDAEAVLIGAPPDGATFARAADAALDGAVARTHNAFKVELAKRAIVRALRTLAR